ncbi:MAG: hypothetical protein IPN29_08655 [Saprospiraceae bacterium]|nr:hypothetical protein [Saprospiraceae bacterium]
MYRLLIFMILVCISCDKIQDSETGIYWYDTTKPTATATRNMPGYKSLKWGANAFLFESNFIKNQFVLHFSNFDNEQNQFFRESIAMGVFPLKEGLYLLNNMANLDCSYDRLQEDGDVADRLWYMNKSYTNYLKIEKIDLKQNLVEGSFDLYFEDLQPAVYPTTMNLPKNVNFLNGHFIVPIL